MQQYIKPVRVVFSILMLISIGFLFLDFRGTLSSVWYERITWLQFTPSILKFFETISHGMAVTAFGFIVILILTLLFGRVYCSFLCPLGIFQDGINRISKKLQKKKRFRFTPPKTWLRYSILIIVLLSLIPGTIFFVNLLDPYSIFGRITSDLIRPAYMLVNNMMTKVFEMLGSYALYPVTIARTNPYALIIPVITLALVVWLSYSKGRIYCNAICPVGTLLGLVSKVSLFKIRFDLSGCNQCGKCMFACKSQCIDVKQQKVDFSRCVACGNCIRSCDKSSISYKLSIAPQQKPKMKGTDSSKRNFLAGSLLFIAAFSGLSIKAIAQKKNRNRGEDQVKGSGKGTGNEEVTKEHEVSPPGAFNFDHFNDTCTACHLCVSACPTGVLKPSFLEYGLLGMMQPYMDYHTSFCNFECVKCGEVCPTGAILPLTVEKKVTTQIGTVRFVKNNCIVFTDETSCGSCSEHCPTQAVRMVPYKGELTIPEVDTSICVGCGACEYACPVTPYKAIIVDGLLVHQEAQKPHHEELEEKPIEEFPF